MRWLVWAAVATLTIVSSSPCASAAPPLPGYADYESLTRELQSLDKSDWVSLRSLGKTLSERDVHLLTVSKPGVDPESKPALLIVGSVEPAALVGGELTVRMVRQLIDEAASDPATAKLLEQYTLYVIPRPSPDASERFFAAPSHESSFNQRATDDDRDGETNEDPPEDLNADGLITQMRVADPTGRWAPHPDEPRVLVEADRHKNEAGRYTLYSEGRDSDGDEQFNEDGPGGVDFNRNFTFRYEFFKPGTGPHQVSERETRAMADFAFARPNIAAVFCFSPQDNLMHPWKSDPNASRGKFKTAIAPEDEPYLKYIAGEFQKLRDGKEPPSAASSGGDFTHWAWFHYGRWTFATRGWWIPPTPQKTETVSEDDATQKKSPAADGAPPEPKSTDEKQPESKASDDKRGATERNALRWLTSQKRDGFVPWTRVEHPDFPGQVVEVGGFKPYLLLNPPASELDELAARHRRFLVALTGWLPRLELRDAKLEPLGGGVYRVTVKVINTGYLPTFSQAGTESEQLQPVQLELAPPEGAKVLTGSPRLTLPTLAGRGGEAERSWVVLVGDTKRREIELKAWSPSVGHAETKLTLPQTAGE